MNPDTVEDPRHPSPAGPAAENALQNVEIRLLGIGATAVGAGVRQRLVARQTQQLDLKRRFHQRQRLSQNGNGVQPVEQVAQKPLMGCVLCGDGLRQLPPDKTPAPSRPDPPGKPLNSSRVAPSLA